MSRPVYGRGGFLNETKMQTRVTETSIAAFDKLNKADQQLVKIARFLIEETKHGRPHSIQTIAAHFGRAMDVALVQTGRVSARLNRIKGGDKKNPPGVWVDGVEYKLQKVKTEINPATNRQNDYYWLVRATAPKAIQTTMF